MDYLNLYAIKGANILFTPGGWEVVNGNDKILLYVGYFIELLILGDFLTDLTPTHFQPAI